MLGVSGVPIWCRDQLCHEFSAEGYYVSVITSLPRHFLQLFG